MPKRLVVFGVVAGLLFGLNTSFAQAQDSTTYYFSGGFEKTILSTGGEEITKYYPLIGGTTAVRKNDQLYFLHQDHLSSTRLVTSEQGTVNSQYDYYPYGSISNPQFTIYNSATDRLYTSQILDDSTDLYFYNARQYNPTTGVFISADVAQGSNRYAYVGGNPISRNDPSGLRYREDAGGGGGKQLMNVDFNQWQKENSKSGTASLEDMFQFMTYLQKSGGYSEPEIISGLLTSYSEAAPRGSRLAGYRDMKRSITEMALSILYQPKFSIANLPVEITTNTGGETMDFVHALVCANQAFGLEKPEPLNIFKRIDSFFSSIRSEYPLDQFYRNPSYDDALLWAQIGGFGADIGHALENLKFEKNNFGLADYQGDTFGYYWAGSLSRNWGNEGLKGFEGAYKRGEKSVKGPSIVYSIYNLIFR